LPVARGREKYGSGVVTSAACVSTPCRRAQQTAPPQRRMPSGITAAAASATAASGAFTARLRRCGRYRSHTLASAAAAAAGAALAQQPRSNGSNTDENGEKYFRPLCDGDVLQASPGQQFVVATTFIILTVGYARAAFMLFSGGGGAGSVLVAAGCVTALVLAVEFADFGTGIYHWAIDNYGSASTPVVGSQIEAFQGHHEEPWTITHRDFCNNCYPTCIATMPFLLGFVALATSPYLLIWSVTACAGIAFCQEFHKYSHTLKSQCHPFANWFQENGLLVARKAHLRHHRPPFETNYCIVTGHMNTFLDRMGFFRVLERLVYRLTGVQPRCQTGDRFDHLLKRKEDIRGSNAARPRPRTAATA